LYNDIVTETPIISQKKKVVKLRQRQYRGSQAAIIEMGAT